jgi:hypothetical protein
MASNMLEQIGERNLPALLAYLLERPTPSPTPSPTTQPTTPPAGAAGRLP